MAGKGAILKELLGRAKTGGLTKTQLGALVATGALTQEEAEASFIGRAAKTFSREALELAEKMTAKGATRDEIWKETGERFGMPTFKDVDGNWKQEISDSFDWDREVGADLNVRGLNRVLEQGSVSHGGVISHPELHQAYPDIGEMPIKALPEGARYEGVYRPDKDEIAINPNLLSPQYASDVQEAQRTLLHETQHAIQGREGFAKGGNLESADFYIERQGERKKQPFANEKYQYDAAVLDQGRYGTADYIAGLDRLSNAENIRPSQITNLSDWYQYSDDIRDNFGSMPKTKAKGRDEWLRNAAAFIRNRNYEQLHYYDKQLVDEAIKDPKKIKSEYRKAQRKAAKHSEGAKQYRQAAQETRRLKELPGYEKYKRLAGEAESRNVEARLPYSLQERIETPPWQTLDVPEDELIVELNKRNLSPSEKARLYTSKAFKPVSVTGGLAGLSGAAQAGPGFAPETGSIRPRRLPMPSVTAPIFDAIEASGDIELPIIGAPFEGIADWARHVGYDDPAEERLKRAFFGALDIAP